MPNIKLIEWMVVKKSITREIQACQKSTLFLHTTSNNFQLFLRENFSNICQTNAAMKIFIQGIIFCLQPFPQVKLSYSNTIICSKISYNIVNLHALIKIN